MNGADRCSTSAPRSTSPGGIPWVRSITRASGASEASTPWQTPTNSSSSPKSDRKTIGRDTIGGPGRGYLPSCRRCQRVFFSSFLCFFLRIFLRRFLTTEDKLHVLSTNEEGQSLVGPEEVAQVHPPDAVVGVDPDRPELQRLRRVGDRGDEPDQVLAVRVLEDAQADAAPASVGETDEEPVELRLVEQGWEGRHEHRRLDAPALQRLGEVVAHRGLAMLGAL